MANKSRDIEFDPIIQVKKTILFSCLPLVFIQHVQRHECIQCFKTLDNVCFFSLDNVCFLSVAWPTGFQLVFFFCYGFSVSYWALRDLHRQAAY